MSIIDVNIADIFNAIGGGSPLSIIDSTLHPQYVIRNSDSNGKKNSVALEFSGMAAIQPSGRAQITTAPVEKGTYKSINKVREPSIVRCEIIITGLTGFTGNIPDIFDLTFTSQSDVLNTIKTMLNAAKIYDIETPKETLQSYDLVEHSYEVSSTKGVSMLVVYLYFQEVMQQMDVAYSGAQSEKKPTDDKKSQGNTGVGGSIKNAGATPSTVDELEKSWASLKKSLGGITTKVSDTITAGFESALDTISKPVMEVADSATKTAADIAKNINENITGG